MNATGREEAEKNALIQSILPFWVKSSTTAQDLIYRNIENNLVSL